MNSVSMHSRPLARASFASRATSSEMARSLMPARPYRPREGATSILVVLLVALDLGVVDAQQPHRRAAGEHDDSEQAAVDRRADQERDHHRDDDDRQADEAGDHAASTLGSLGILDGSKRLSRA